MTNHMGVQRKLHRFVYLIVQIILCFYSQVSHAILSLYFSSLSPAPEINTGNFAPAETTSEAYYNVGDVCDFIIGMMLHQRSNVWNRR